MRIHPVLSLPKAQQHDPMYCCPSFLWCNAPICPLEDIYPSLRRKTLLGERRCQARQTIRYKLGAALKFHGLLAHEYYGFISTTGFGKFEGKP